MGATDVRITYEDELQSELIFVIRKKLTDDQIRCVGQLQHSPPHPIILFEDQQATRRSFEFDREDDRKAALAWLTEREMLDRLPKYDPKEGNLKAYAERLETFCGIESGTYLAVHESGGLTMKPTWPPPDVPEEKFWCLMHSVTASNLEEHGIAFGLFGNEALPEAGD